MPGPHRPPRDPLIASARPGPVLIGLAHGSRHPGVVTAVDRLLSAVADAEGLEVRTAFLDLAEPDLTTVAADLEAAGRRRAIVVPLLFTTAYHARTDVPEAAAEAQAVSGVELRVADVLGTGPDVAAVLRVAMAEAGVEADRAVLLYAVGSSSESANQAVHDLAAQLTQGRAAPVRAGFGTAEPRAADVLATLGEPVAIVPLFVAPGVLLTSLLRTADERGWLTTPPLSERLAPVVAQRYHEVAAAVAGLG